LRAGGFNKETFPWRTFFFACAVCSLLRQLGVVELRIEFPFLLIILGILLGINQTGIIPAKAGTNSTPLVK